MARKTIIAINRLSLLLVLGIFPFGQAPSLALSFLTGSIRSIQLIDVFVAIFVVTSFILHRTLFSNLIHSNSIKIICLFMFSFFTGLALGNVSGNTSLLYVARIEIYILFGFILTALKPLKGKVFKSLLIIGGLTALFGLVQYFVIPDTRMLKIYGWDDHYFRLIGTFIDPSYIGILLVLTILLCINKLKTGTFKYIFLASLFISLLLTYSRASFLALIVGIIVLLMTNSKMAIRLGIFIALFVVSLYLLPRPSSEGVKLERTFSIFLRAQNYQETVRIWETSPLLGVGYNNMCVVRNRLFNNQTTALVSHSCGGADNSFLLLLATTGVVGVIGVGGLMLQLFRRVQKKDQVITFALLGSLAVHAFFANTLFYPWILVWSVVYLSSLTLTD